MGVREGGKGGKERSTGDFPRENYVNFGDFLFDQTLPDISFDGNEMFSNRTRPEFMSAPIPEPTFSVFLFC